MEDYTTPRNRIYVDEDLCGNAIECLKCVQACLDHGVRLVTRDEDFRHLSRFGGLRLAG